MSRPHLAQDPGPPFAPAGHALERRHQETEPGTHVDRIFLKPESWLRLATSPWLEHS